MRRRNVAALVIAVALAAGTAIGCSVEEPKPSMTGPSEFALSISLLASPDQLPRDGSSQAIVTATVRNEVGRPVSGQQLSITSNTGTLSTTEAVTGDDGRATFAFVAPAAGTGFNSAAISVTPIGGMTRTNFARTLTIPLTAGTGVTSVTAPTASFTASATSTTRGETVTFDASASTDEGIRCLDLCTYSWNFGGEATGSGRIATYQFRNARAYAVTLTVTDGAGATSTTTQTVTVALGTDPTAEFTFSPDSPGIFESISFTAEASRPGQAGRTLVSHVWQFGDGSNAVGLRATKSYDRIGTYTVTLTVTDSAGAQGTETAEVTVVTGVTASFTTSNPADLSLSVLFNAEESRGSSTGFGSRNTIVKYIWSWGEPTNTSLEETTSPRILHTFPGVGPYRVTLTVEDSAGRRETTSTALTVVN